MAGTLTGMKAVTLEPGVWTELDGYRFQVRGQKVLRLAYGDWDYTGTAPKMLPPDPATEAYFLTPGYDAKPIVTEDYFGIAGVGLATSVYAMPHEDEPVTVVFWRS